MNPMCEEYGFEATFVEKPQEIYICTVCQLVLRNPVMIMQCGHRYCGPCFDRLKTHSQQMRIELRCPEDRDVIDLTRVCEDHGLRRAVNNLVVKCTEWEGGCLWVGELSELNIHENSCEYKTPSTNSSPQELIKLRTEVDTLRERLALLEITCGEKDKGLAVINYRMQELEKKCNDEVDTMKQKIEKCEAEACLVKQRNDDLIKQVNLLQQVEVGFREEVEKNRLLEERIRLMEISRKEKEEQGKEIIQSFKLKAPNVAKKIHFTAIDVGSKKCKITEGNCVEFIAWCTVVAPDGLVPLGSKGYYEVLFNGGKDDIRVGWATQTFLTRLTSNRKVGDCSNSYAFNCDCAAKSRSAMLDLWGVKIDYKGDSVLGVAVDMVQGRILYSKDGNWDAPMGVAFTDIGTTKPYFPAISCGNAKLFVNVGQVDFKFGPPDASFKKLVEL